MWLLCWWWRIDGGSRGGILFKCGRGNSCKSNIVKEAMVLVVMVMAVVVVVLVVGVVVMVVVVVVLW